MKKLAILVAAATMAIPAMSQSFADKLVDTYRVGYDEAVLLGGLARDFGISDSAIFDLRNRYGYRNDDMLNALYVNKHGRTSWDKIHSMRRSGMGWGQIAHSIGMHPGQFNKARKNAKWGNDREMADDLWRDRFNRRGSTAKDVDWARNQGFSYRDAYVADQIARANNSRFPTVLNQYRQSRSWQSAGILRGGSAQQGNIRDMAGRSGDKKVSPPKRGNSGDKKAAPPKRGNSGNKGNKGKENKGNKGRGNGGFLGGR